MLTANDFTTSPKRTAFQEAAVHDANLVSRFNSGDIAAFEEIIPFNVTGTGSSLSRFAS